MLVRDMVRILRPYGIYLHPNGVIKIEGDSMSIAYAYVNAPNLDDINKPQVINNIAIRGRAWPYINQIKTLKEICKQHNVELAPISGDMYI